MLGHYQILTGSGHGCKAWIGRSRNNLPDGVCMPGQACYMQSHSGYYCAKGSSMPPGIYIKSEYSESIWYIVLRPGSNWMWGICQDKEELNMLTLIVRVQIAAITSSESPRTRLSSYEGLYSQMAVAFLTTGIFMICSITSMFPRFTTWPRQLREDQRDNIKDKEKTWQMYGNCCSLLFHLGRPRISAIVWQVVLLFPVLSKVAVYSRHENIWSNCDHKVTWIVYLPLIAFGS